MAAATMAAGAPLAKGVGNRPAVRCPHVKLPTHRPWVAAAAPFQGDAGPAAGGGGGGIGGSGEGVVSSLDTFLQNPAIAQREVLRHFYLSTSAEEQVQLVHAAAGVLDTNTSLHILCHTADLSLKGLLPGDAAQQETLLSAIHASLEQALPTMQPVHLGTLLWGFASVGLQPPWMPGLLQDVAGRELQTARIPAYNTRELTSIIHAYGRLARRPTLNMQEYVAALAQELGKRWEASPYVRGSFTSTDFADLVHACSQLFPAGATPTDINSSSSSSTSRVGAAVPLPPSVAALLDYVAQEVRRQLANKHSTRSPFTPRDLLRFLRAYAGAGHATPATAAMLDVVSSFVVQRIRSRHLNAISRPADLCGLLAAYADLRHATVAVPELLAAVGEQIRRGAAQQQERLCTTTPSSSSAGGAVGAAGTAALKGSAPGSSAGTAAGAAVAARAAGPDEGFHLEEVLVLVESTCRLGYRPSELVLQALQPSICPQLPTAEPRVVVGLLWALVGAGHHPGSVALGLMLARLEDTGDPALLAAGREAAEQLSFTT